MYFIGLRDPADRHREFGLVKVGVTTSDVASRIGQLQTGNPYELVCLDSFETPCAREVEYFIHKDQAGDRLHGEWIRCSREDVPALVEIARRAARQFQERRERYDECMSRASNGSERRATLNEFNVHREARHIHRELVAAELQRDLFENRLKAATAATLGIDGVVRAKYVSARLLFSTRLARDRFPELAALCSREETRGTFRWRKVPTRYQSHFSAAHLQVMQAEADANVSAAAVLQSGQPLQGWTPRTPDIARWHTGYLEAIEIATRWRMELASLEMRLIESLDAYQGLEGVCSFRRYRSCRLNRNAFLTAHPDAALQCAMTTQPQLRKVVYQHRSYEAHNTAS